MDVDVDVDVIVGVGVIVDDTVILAVHVHGNAPVDVIEASEVTRGGIADF